MSSKVTSHRVQVNLPADLYQLVRSLAYQKNSSISEIVRQAIVKSEKVPNVKINKTDKKDEWEIFLKKYAGSVKGHKDDSQTHSYWAGQSATMSQA